MGRKRKAEKRIMSEEGWLYYCNNCQIHLPEEEFNNDKNRPFGKYYICKDCRKEQYKNRNGIEDGLEHIKLTYASPEQKEMVNVLLQRLGYDTSKNIHQQFLIKTNLQIDE